jgi:hypothetical protein
MTPPHNADVIALSATDATGRVHREQHAADDVDRLNVDCTTNVLPMMSLTARDVSTGISKGQLQALHHVERPVEASIPLCQRTRARTMSGNEGNRACDRGSQPGADVHVQEPDITNWPVYALSLRTALLQGGQRAQMYFIDTPNFSPRYLQRRQLVQPPTRTPIFTSLYNVSGTRHR